MAEVSIDSGGSRDRGREAETEMTEAAEDQGMNKE
jgi:hypothetical protein